MGRIRTDDSKMLYLKQYYRANAVHVQTCKSACKQQCPVKLNENLLEHML